MGRTKKREEVEEEEKEEEEEEVEVYQHEVGGEEDEGPSPIDSLTDQGVGAPDIKKLKASGYYTVESVAFAPK